MYPMLLEGHDKGGKETKESSRNRGGGAREETRIKVEEREEAKDPRGEGEEARYPGIYQGALRSPSAIYSSVGNAERRELNAGIAGKHPARPA